MKKHLSVLMLYISAPFYKILALMVAMVGIELAGYGLLGYGNEAIFGHNSGDFLYGVSFVTFIGIMLLLVLGPGRRTSYRYTLQRLQVSERWVFFWNSVANLLYLTLLWMVQILVVAVLAKQCLANPDYPGGLQGVYVDLYRSRYLHGMIPLKNPLLWVRNIVMMVALAITFAYMALMGQYEKGTVMGGIVVGVAVALFQHDARSSAESLGILISIMLVLVIVMISRAMEICHNGRRREGSHE